MRYRCRDGKRPLRSGSGDQCGVRLHDLLDKVLVLRLTASAGVHGRAGVGAFAAGTHPRDRCVISVGSEWPQPQVVTPHWSPYLSFVFYSLSFEASQRRYRRRPKSRRDSTGKWNSASAGRSAPLTAPSKAKYRLSRGMMSMPAVSSVLYAWPVELDSAINHTSTTYTHQRRCALHS